MGRSESGLFSYSKLQGGSPRLSWLRIASVGPPAISVDYVLTHRVWTIPYLASWMIRRDSARATHGLPDEVFAWKMALGWGRTRPDSLIVIAKGSHSSWLTCVVLSDYFPLKDDYWFESLRHPWIWVKLIPWALNVDMRWCVWLIWGFLDDIDYFVVMAQCYIIYCMSYRCMLSIGC
jgi:hypothetical protein